MAGQPLAEKILAYMLGHPSISEYLFVKIDRCVKISDCGQSAGK